MILSFLVLGSDSNILNVFWGYHRLGPVLIRLSMRVFCVCMYFVVGNLLFYYYGDLIGLKYGLWVASIIFGILTRQ